MTQHGHSIPVTHLSEPPRYRIAKTNSYLLCKDSTIVMLGVIHLWRPQENQHFYPRPFTSTWDWSPPLVDVSTPSTWITQHSLEISITM